ncbi:hypothetical protein [Microbulbifer sp. GL-2]|uniref:hypothetical protein n=1 Tax=Microbulbifer sp. GL-2 TaxID=2591606 RepID=UPI00117DBB13|nr:hypothetical protein [Microbulbifer sp. GL-2]
MKKILTALALTIVSTGAAADTWSPQGTIGLANVGNIAVKKGINLNCGLSGSTTVDAAGNSSVGSLSLSGFLCGSVTFTKLPYTLVGNADNTVTLHNVNVNAITGDCFGNITGDFNQATGELTFNAAQLPSVGTGANCEISGTISTNPQASFVP